MRQSTVIFGVLIFAFVVYITMRGQLPAYLALFSSSNTSTSSAPKSTSSAETKSSGIDWGGVEAGDWGAIGDALNKGLTKLGF